MKFSLVVKRKHGVIERLRTRIRISLVTRAMEYIERNATLLMLIPQVSSQGRITSTQMLRCNLSEENAEYVLFQAADLAEAQADVVSEAYDILTDNNEDESDQ